MATLRLYKSEKLCSQIAIDALFSRRVSHSMPENVHAALSYPIRAVWRLSDRTTGAPVRFLVSVPKKRLRHAVDRVTMRRRVREAYRLNRHLIPHIDRPVDIAFIYVADTLVPYRSVEHAVCRLLRRLSPSPKPQDHDTLESDQ